MFYLKPTVWEQTVRMSGLKSWNSRTLWCFVCMACFKHRNLDPPDQTYFSHWRMATAQNSWPPKVAGSRRNISNDAPFLVGPKGQPFLGTSPHNPIVCSSFSLCNLPQIGAKSWRIPWHVAISKPHSQWLTPGLHLLADVWEATHRRNWKTLTVPDGWFWKGAGGHLNTSTGDLKGLQPMNTE